MATRAIIAYLSEDKELTTTYNHYDGYPDGLGKALLNHYDDDSKANIVANVGYISSIDPDTGEITSNNSESPNKMDLNGDWEESLYEIVDEIKSYGVDYAYIWNEVGGDWNRISNGSATNMVRDLANQMSSAEYMFGPVDENEKEEKMEEIEENYNTKWNEFITENKIIDDQWTIYVKSLVNDIKLNGVDGYVDFSEGDFKEDFDNYIADKMDM
mgnify:FL=1|jgi:hypothetical protein|tara:strand:+ start:626 stop:1267 length:642 start_codon:yes stop_codon:yes gene_type:complete